MSRTLVSDEAEQLAESAAGVSQPEPPTDRGSDPPEQRRRRKKGTRATRGGGGAGGQTWMLVSSPDNYRKTREHGFTAQGIKSRHRRRAETIRPGDQILYYMTGRMAFVATVTVTSPMYEDHQIIWRSARREEDYPWRVRIRPELVLEEADWIMAKDLAFRLEYVRKWPPDSWTLAFQGHLHQLPQKDYKLVEDEIRRSLRNRSVAS